ncbi:hypothetical protein [uncultured Maribacter sp.]|uniref:hypothetical protein n=1 Tax=uncultured Maribacter sp. TaxID=431308 RepID=UPI0026276038|nr:hypothetical protein [uncultured Maribacter sp.]
MISLKSPKLLSLFLIVFLLFSCSKDSDLLSDLVLKDENGELVSIKNIQNDYFEIKNTSIVLDVLENDNYESLDNVQITKVSNPINGIVEINENKTITYTIINSEDTTQEDTTQEDTTQEDTTQEDTTQEDTTQEDTTQEDTTQEDATSEPNVSTDTFTYTTEVTNEDNTITTEEATVTVEIVNTNTSEDNVNEENSSQSYEDGYFVTSYGNSSNDGSSENHPWSIQHAINVAQAGDIVYVKAGDYGHVELLQYNSGTSENPIKFIGYHNTPGDISTDSNPSYSYGDSYDDLHLPKFSGNGNGISFKIQGENVHLENFVLANYDAGIVSSGNHNLVKNFIVFNVGNQNSDEYNGFGIRVSGYGVKVENSFVLNAGAEGITIRESENARVLNCSVYSDNTINPTDYYILFNGNVRNSLIQNSTVYRGEGLHHPGHGLVFKDGPQYNTIRNSKVVNTNIEMNYGNVAFNTIESTTLTGSYYSSGDTAGGIELNNGAHDNTFNDINVSGTWGGVRFKDYYDGSSPNDLVNAGHHNTFNRITISNCQEAILMDEFGHEYGGETHDNTFDDCSISNCQSLIRVYRPNSNFKISNTSIDNVSELKDENKSFTLNANTIFENCTTTNTNFTLP